MFLLAALAKPLILTILTDKWLDAVIYLQIFCFGYMFNHLNSMNLNILYVKGYSNLVLRLEIIKKTISISMIVAAIPFGPLAICIAGTVYTHIAVVINTYYTGKLFGLGYTKQFKDFFKYLLGAFISVIPVYLITLTSIAPVFQLILGGIIAVVVYFIIVYKDKYFTELLNLVFRKNKFN